MGIRLVTPRSSYALGRRTWVRTERLLEDHDQPFYGGDARQRRQPPSCSKCRKPMPRGDFALFCAECRG